MNSILIQRLSLGFALVVGLALTGCEPPETRAPNSMAVGITGYNFTNEGVQEFYVNDIYASNLSPYGGGGGTSCCIRLSGQWTPELTVKVNWTMGHWTTPYETRKRLTIPEQIKCCFTERTLSKTVPIERYGAEGGLVQVFFLPGDEIKVWVYDAGPQNPGHPSHMGYPKKPASSE